MHFQTAESPDVFKTEDIAVIQMEKYMFMFALWNSRVFNPDDTSHAEMEHQNITVIQTGNDITGPPPDMQNFAPS